MVERQASDESGGARGGWTALSGRAVSQAADVIVVGGGPAGAMAAMTLAARGVSTLLVDKKRFPRDKPCGGGIRYGVYRRFPELVDYLRTTVTIHEIRKVRMEGPSGASVLAESDEPFYLTLRRTEFDAALLARARPTSITRASWRTRAPAASSPATRIRRTSRPTGCRSAAPSRGPTPTASSSAATPRGSSTATRVRGSTTRW